MMPRLIIIAVVLITAIQLQQQHQQQQQSRDSSVTRRNCDSQARYITGSRYNKPT